MKLSINLPQSILPHQLISWLSSIIMSKFLVTVTIYAVLAFIALRGLFLRSGTIGHNWDWNISPLNSQLKNGLGDFYSLSDLSLGKTVIGDSYAPFNALLNNAGYLGLDGDFVSKFLLFFTIVIAGTTMFYLIRDILRFEFGSRTVSNPHMITACSFLAGLIYALSPYLFNDFIGGAATQFISYSFLPLALYLFRKLARSGSLKHMILLAITLSIIAISFHNLFFISTLLWLYVVIHKSRLRLLRNLGITYGIFIALCLFWILPLIWSSFNDLPRIPDNPVSIHNVKEGVPSISQVFIGTGFFDRHFFTGSVNKTIEPLWRICSTGLIIVTITSLFFFGKRRSKEAIFWGILLLPAFVTATGGKAPLGDVIVWMYETISQMIFFRSLQHFLVPLTIILAVLIGMGSYALVSRFHSHRLLSCIFLFAMTAIWLSPFWSGDLGLGELQNRKGGNFVTTFQVSPGLESVLDTLDNNKESDSRVLCLPMSFSPYYLETEYQVEGQGGDPILVHTPNVVLDNTSNIYAGDYIDILQHTLYDRGEYNSSYFANLLQMADIEHIILRKDVKPIFGPYASLWDWQTIYTMLEQANEFRLIEEHAYVSLWENIEPRPPHIYSTSSLVHLPQGYQVLDLATSSGMFPDDTAYSINPHFVPSQQGEQLTTTYFLPESNFSYTENQFWKSIFDFENEFDLSNTWGDSNFRITQNDPLSALSLNSDPDYVKNGNHSIRAFFNYDTLAGGGAVNFRLPDERHGSSSVSLGLWLYYPETPPSNCNVQLLTFSEDWKLLANKTFHIDNEGWIHLSLTIPQTSVKEMEYFRLQLFDPAVNYKNIPLYIDDISLQILPIMEHNGKPAINLPKDYTSKTEIEIASSGVYTVGIQASANSTGTLTFHIDNREVDITVSKTSRTSQQWSEPIHITEGTHRFLISSDVDVILNTIVLSESTNTSSNSSIPKVSFHKTSPVKYRAEISGATQPFFLVFLESFDPNWSASIKGQHSISEEDHTLINGYANAWYINPADYGTNGEFEVILYYQPQSIADVGLIISGIVFAGSCATLVWDNRRKRHQIRQNKTLAISSGD